MSFNTVLNGLLIPKPVFVTTETRAELSRETGRLLSTKQQIFCQLSFQQNIKNAIFSIMYLLTFYSY